MLDLFFSTLYMMKLIPKSFYTNDDVVFIAKALLGKILVTKINNETIHCRIVETEAYQGPEDNASHTFNNKRNEKNKVMYEEGGHAYVYISYGIHHMLNVVTSKKNIGHAVLIRAVEPIKNIEAIIENRGLEKNDHTLTGGPGKVCQALNITKAHNMCKYYSRNSCIQIFDDGYEVAEIVTTPRVGMSVHVKPAANWPYRFYIKGNKWVSKPLNLFYKFD
jgi:DNA-3-methyladenine glycosylase